MKASRVTWSALFGAASLVLSAGQSHAGVRLFHPTACGAAATTGDNVGYNATPPYITPSTGQASNFATNLQLVFFCPLITDPQVTLPAPGINRPVAVSMFSNGSGTSSQTYTKACRVFAGGGGQGQSCSTVNLPSPGSGVKQIPVEVLSGGSAGDYYYLVVSLGPADLNTHSANTLFGYSISN